MSTFRTTRQLAAEPAAVIAAIQDPTRLARRRGNGFSIRLELLDFRPGDRWAFSMIGPDGTTYPNESVSAGLALDCQVVIQHLSQPHFQLTITLDPSAGGTLVRWEQAFADASVAQAIRHIVEPANEQNLDRLSRELGLGGACAA